jgi:hypothetical protein
LIKKRTQRGAEGSSFGFAAVVAAGERTESRGEGNERKGERQGDEEDGRRARRSRGESKKDG